MNVKNPDYREDSSGRRGPGAPLVEAETLRSTSQAPAVDEAAKEEKKLPMFWRVFGGTVLSIAALLAVTLYQQLHGKIERISDTDVNKDEFNDFKKTIWDRLGKMKAEDAAAGNELGKRCLQIEQTMVKKDEFFDHRKSSWDRVDKIRASGETAAADLRQRCAQLELQVKQADELRKEMLQEIKQVREATFTLLKETSAKMETQIKQGEDERKRLLGELEKMRERLSTTVQGSGVKHAIHKEEK